MENDDGEGVVEGDQGCDGDQGSANAVASGGGGREDGGQKGQADVGDVATEGCLGEGAAGLGRCICEGGPGEAEQADEDGTTCECKDQLDGFRAREGGCCGGVKEEGGECDPEGQSVEVGEEIWAKEFFPGEDEAQEDDEDEGREEVKDIDHGVE